MWVIANTRAQRLDWPQATRTAVTSRYALHMPDWSPDGRLIAVTSANHNGTGEIFVVSVTDNAYATIGNVGRRGDLKWSPDGNQLIGYNWNGLSTLTYPGLEAGPRIAGSQADWSPDGEQLVIYLPGTPAPYGTPTRLVVTDLEGNDLTELLVDSERYYNYGGLSWSPASNLIALSGGRWTIDSSPHRHIRIINPDTAQTTLLIDSPADEFSPSWSPDGDWLIYIAREIYAYEAVGTVIFARADGSCTIPALGATSLFGVAWSPDGTRLAITQGEHLYIVDIVLAFGEAFGDLNALCGNRQ
jgi:Tol biopolymer transport system component